MKTSAVASATVGTAGSSSLAYGRVARASWSGMRMGMRMGKHRSAIHGNEIAGGDLPAGT